MSSQQKTIANNMSPPSTSSASASTSASTSASVATTESGYRLPDSNTLQHAAKLSITEDKPIMFDYWTSSLDKKVIIGVKEDQEKLLVKSEDEYTSSITRILKAGTKGTEFIIVTENSIYIVDNKIDVKRISS
jgi:hypothetical protein